MIGSQHHASEHRAADQAAGLGYRADEQRYREPDRNDSRQRDSEPIYREPVQSKRLGVKNELQGDAGDDQHGGHHQRPDEDFACDRQAPERCAEGGPSRRRKPGLHSPYGQRDTDPVQAAAKIVPQIPLGDGIEQMAIGDAEKSTDQKRGQNAPVLCGASQKNRTEWAIFSRE
jgi:hypothetical protein